MFFYLFLKFSCTFAYFYLLSTIVLLIINAIWLLVPPIALCSRPCKQPYLYPHNNSFDFRHDSGFSFLQYVNWMFLEKYMKERRIRLSFPQLKCRMRHIMGWMWGSGMPHLCSLKIWKFHIIFISFLLFISRGVLWTICC